MTLRELLERIRKSENLCPCEKQDFMSYELRIVEIDGCDCSLSNVEIDDKNQMIFFK